MSKLIVEVVSSKGQPAPEVVSQTTVMPGTFQMNVCFAGAVVRMSRIVLPNPKTGELVECLQLEANGSVQVVIPEEFQADFAVAKRRKGRAKKAPAAPTAVAGSGSGAPRRRQGDSLAAFRDLETHAGPASEPAGADMVVGSIAFAPNPPAGKLALEPVKQPWGILGRG